MAAASRRSRGIPLSSPRGRPAPLLRAPGRRRVGRARPAVGIARAARPPNGSRRRLALVRTGRRFALNLPLDVPDPPFFGRQAMRHEVFELLPGMVLDDKPRQLLSAGVDAVGRLRPLRPRHARFFGGVDSETAKAGRARDRRLGPHRDRGPRRAARRRPARTGARRAASRSTKPRSSTADRLDGHRRGAGGVELRRRATSCASAPDGSALPRPRPDAAGAALAGSTRLHVRALPHSRARARPGDRRVPVAPRRRRARRRQPGRRAVRTRATTGGRQDPGRLVAHAACSRCSASPSASSSTSTHSPTTARRRARTSSCSRARR